MTTTVRTGIVCHPEVLRRNYCPTCQIFFILLCENLRDLREKILPADFAELRRITNTTIRFLSKYTSPQNQTIPQILFLIQSTDKPLNWRCLFCW